MIRSYSQIFNLGHKALERLFDGPVVVQEKVDGSQFSFGFFNGNVRFRSKTQEIDTAYPPKLFDKGLEAVLSRADQLQPGWVYRGEYLRTPRHNRLEYERVPSGHVILFDIDKGDQDYCDPALVTAEAERLGFETVPCLHTGVIGNATEVSALLSRTSVLGKASIEGVVVKNYSQFNVDSKVLMGKFVSESFRETKLHPSFVGQGDVVEKLVSRLATEARFAKAVQHLREAGTLQNALQDIGPLLVELERDVRAEEEDRIKIALFQNYWPKIKRGLVKGFPEWYKRVLLESQFVDEPLPAPAPEVIDAVLH